MHLFLPTTRPSFPSNTLPPCSHRATPAQGSTFNWCLWATPGASWNRTESRRRSLSTSSGNEERWARLVVIICGPSECPPSFRFCSKAPFEGYATLFSGNRTIPHLLVTLCYNVGPYPFVVLIFAALYTPHPLRPTPIGFRNTRMAPTHTWCVFLAVISQYLWSNIFLDNIDHLPAGDLHRLCLVVVLQVEFYNRAI